jgi:hypothetical protein
MMTICLFSSSMYLISRAFEYKRKLNNLQKNVVIYKNPTDFHKMLDHVKTQNKNFTNQQMVELFLECDTMNLPIGSIEINQLIKHQSDKLPIIAYLNYISNYNNISDYNAYRLLRLYDYHMTKYSNEKNVILKNLIKFNLLDYKRFEIKDKLIFQLNSSSNCKWILSNKNIKYTFYNNIFNASEDYKNFMSKYYPNFISDTFATIKLNYPVEMITNFIPNKQFYMLVDAELKKLEESEQLILIPKIISDSKSTLIESAFEKEQFEADFYFLLSIVTFASGIFCGFSIF